MAESNTLHGMGLRDELAGLDDLGRAAAIVTWATGMPATTPCTTSNVGGPPTLTSAFFVPLPGTLKLDLLGAGFEVEGSDRETRPGKRAYEVRDDGSVWTHLGGERAQVHEASVSVLLLETVLHWIRLHAPASLQLEVETAERLRDYAQQFELLHLSVNRRLDLAVFSWLAGKNIVGFLREGDAAGRVPTVELLGPSRSAVEAEQGRGGIVYGWASVERAMEPETDRWSPPNAPFPGGHSRAVSDLDDILGEADGVRALERFLAAWYGVELPQATEADERPVALARLAQVSNIADLFRDGHLLLEESDRSAAVGGLQRDHPDAVPAWAECQYLTIAGYVPDRDDPTVVFTHDVPGGELTQPAIHPNAPLGRFLLRALIDEAIFHSPVCVSTSYVEAEEVDRILADMTVAIPGIDRWSPVWTDGRVLTVVHRHERSGIAAAPQVHIAAHRRSDVVESPAGRLPRLAWSYADDSPGRPSTVRRRARQACEAPLATCSDERVVTRFGGADRPQPSAGSDSARGCAVEDEGTRDAHVGRRHARPVPRRRARHSMLRGPRRVVQALCECWLVSGGPGLGELGGRLPG